MKRPSCADLAELRSAYVDGALTGLDRDRLLAHLSDCAECRAEVAELHGLRELLGGHRHQVPSELSSRLVSIAGTDAAQPLWARPFRRVAMGSLPRHRHRLRRRTTGVLMGFGAAFVTLTGIGYASAPVPNIETINDPSAEAQAEFSAMVGQIQLTTDSVSAVLLSRQGLSPTVISQESVAARAPYKMLDASHARKVIKKAARAADQVSYSGSQYYRATLFGQSFIATVQVAAHQGQGSWLEVYNLAGQKILNGYLPAEVRGAVVGDDLLDLLQDNYQLTGWVGGRVAGRSATVIEARSAGVVVARWWVDRETGLLLRQQSFDRTGRLVMESGFDRVNIEESAAQFQDHLPQRSVVPTTTVELSRDQAGALRAAGWFAPPTLQGLDLVRLRADQANDPQALSLLYSDGLSAVSVGLQRGKMATAPADSSWDASLEAYVRHGTSNVASWQSGDVVYTVVTDGSSQLFDEAVRALPHGGETERTTMGRVRAGWAKIMDQVKR